MKYGDPPNTLDLGGLMDISTARQPETTRTTATHYITMDEVLAALGIRVPAGGNAAWSINSGLLLHISVEHTEGSNGTEQ